MKKLFALLAFLVWATPAFAQPAVFCPTRPPGDNTNACASTAFVIANGGGGGGGSNLVVGTTPITSGTANRLLYEAGGNVLGEIVTGAAGTVLHSGAPPAFSSVVSADLNITTTSCGAGQFISAISAIGVGTCETPTGAGNVSAGGTLTSNQLVLGAGTTAVATLGSLGTTTTVLHGNAAGAPTFGAVISADLNITTTTCTDQFITGISASGVGTCNTATITGTQFANQGTATTLLHGNAAGNPSWDKVVSADLNITATTCGAGTFVSSISSSAIGTCTVAGGGVTGLGNPTASIGLTAVNGSATTAMRSDGAPALDQGIIPTWTAQHIFNAATLFSDGTVSLPGLAFSGDTNSGIYRIGGDNIGVAVNGAKVLDVSTTGLGVVGKLLNGDGTVSLPAFSFTSDTDSGLYRIGANNLGVAVGGAKAVDISTTAFGLPASYYLNFGATLGTSGYGIRDNAGIIECKNSGGGWSACNSSSVGTIFVSNGASAGVGASPAVLYVGTGDISSATTEALVQFTAPRNGVLRNLCIHTTTAQSGTGSLVFTIRKGAVSTSVATTLAASAAANTNQCNTANSVSVTQLELISVLLTNNASATSAASIVSYQLD